MILTAFKFCFRGCVLVMFVTSCFATYYIYIPGQLGFCFINIVQLMMSANSRIRSGLQIVFLCFYITPSHYHHCANLSEDIEIIKCLPDNFLSSVWVRFSIFSQYPLYNIWGCVFSFYPFPLWWLREYVNFVLSPSSNRTYELLSIV